MEHTSHLLMLWPAVPCPFKRDAGGCTAEKRKKIKTSEPVRRLDKHALTLCAATLNSNSNLESPKTLCPNPDPQRPPLIFQNNSLIPRTCHSNPASLYLAKTEARRLPVEAGQQAQADVPNRKKQLNPTRTGEESRVWSATRYGVEQWDLVNWEVSW